MTDSNSNLVSEHSHKELHGQKSSPKILVTIALPYANGPMHLGHVIEAIQADIWVRWQRQQQRECLFICGTDAHGTAIMLSAEQHNMTPEKWVESLREQYYSQYQSLLVNFDIFHTTHSPENQALSELIFKRLQAKGDISTRTITQAYDPEKNIFLADRFIRGNCPRCHAPDQYGDNCEVCGASYNPTELENPKSTLSNTMPITKESLHYFFELEHYREQLEHWVNDQHLQPQVANKLREWFHEELKSWDISRDAPYFGFRIPDTEDKYFYVWMDAPIGYIAATQKLCQLKPEHHFNDYWSHDSPSELYHFVGKDIIYFHALFWPAMLDGAGFRLPTRVFAHGFLTVNGEKMSKSRGTFITTARYLQYLNPEYLRYYFAAKLSAQVEDIDLNFDDFRNRVNADLVGKFVNLASRCAGFINKNFSGQLAAKLDDQNLYDEFVKAGDQIAEHYRTLNYNRAVREIMALADKANQYIDQKKPWVLAKQAGNELQTQSVCTQGLNLFKLLATYLAPILPETSQRICEFLNIKELGWLSRQHALLNHTINPFVPLLQRVDEHALLTLKGP